MNRLNRNSVEAKRYPERIIQFGEGNFLRAFVDWIVWNTNKKTDFDAGVVVVQPIENGMADMLNEQNGLYHLNLQGLSGSREIDSIELIDVIQRAVNPYCNFIEYLNIAENPEIRFVISNTTEAGITFDPSCKLTDEPAASYPGKLTQLLYHRFRHFSGDPKRGLLIFPCELIFHNGRELKRCIEQYIELWDLGAEFRRWFEEACGVYSTLVDRIVPGYPKETAAELCERVGVEDKLLVKGEIFHLWVIEAPQWVAAEFPADRAGLNVLFVEDETPYHACKVTLLNGPHTVLAPVGYLCGLNTVKQCVEDPIIGKYVHRVMFDELLPTLDLPREELTRFADDVIARFRNPFVKHFVTSIMLNSFPKFKARDLPGVKIYWERNGRLPEGIVMGLAAITTYYKGGKRGMEAIDPQDDPAILKLLAELWATGDLAHIARGVLGAEFIWGEDLNRIDGLTALLYADLTLIHEKCMLEAVKTIV